MALGCISAGGALGILIPPSVTMIVYGLVANVSVGRLYAGGLMPGLLLAVLFILYIGIRSALQPKIAPAIPPEESYTFKEKIIHAKSIVAPAALVIAVWGGIFKGYASISEAAAVGAFGSIICAVINRKLTINLLKESCERTLVLTGLIMWIIIAAAAFSTFYVRIGASNLIQEIILGLEMNRWVILFGIQILLVVLGMVMETTGIIMITVPVFYPIITALKFDPVWFGVLFIVNMELGFLTPPFGYNLFYLKGVAPDTVTMMDLYKSVTPFLLLQALGLLLCVIFPDIILWLPNLIFG